VLCVVCVVRVCCVCVVRVCDGCVCENRHSQGGIGGWLLSLLWYSLLVSMVPVATHTLAFQKVTGIVYSTPSLGARQRAAGTCLSSGAYGVYGFPVADQPKMCVHTHVGMGDHVSSHRESLNPSPMQTLSSWGLR
jgi:hypothetical protein